MYCLRQQKGASPSKVRRQILYIFIIHIELKSYIPSVLKYYNEVLFNVLHEEISSIKLFQIGLTWFRLKLVILTIDFATDFYITISFTTNFCKLS